MCGISGIVVLEADAHAERADFLQAVRDMVAHQRDRGPDDQGLWNGGGAYFGHTRLAIMDPGSDLARQPVVTDDWTIMFNGEIYNFRALGERLRRDHGVVIESASDTEVLVRAIQTWGFEATLPELNGIFAIAAFDRRRHELFLARDRLGVKPLFYCETDNALWFASTPAAIALGSGARWQLNYDAVAAFFRLGTTFSEDTLFTGISRLPAGTWLHISLSGVSAPHKYWLPRYRPGELTAEIERAVSLQRESHVRSAVFLSGGVDSSVMASMLHEMDCFHLKSEETRYAQYVADHAQSTLTISGYGETRDFDVFNDAYIASSGEPSASAPIPYLIANRIHAAGYKVAFSANGADELFFGYPRTPAPELSPSHTPANLYETPPVQDADAQFRHVMRARKLLRVANASETDADEVLARFEAVDADLDPAFPDSARYRWRELKSYVEFDLNPTLDFSSMACSLEVRVPFLDHLLVEAALSAPADEIVSADLGRKTPLKRLLKSAGIHPLLWARPKVGFSVPREDRQARDRSARKSLLKLQRSGLLKISRGLSTGSRDELYLLAAAHAFDRWLKIWVDREIVVL